MTKLRHYDHLGTARFVTFSCFHRYRLLDEAPVIRAFLTELNLLRKRGASILGHVVRPAREKIEYCHKNPVTRGLVKDPGDWPWSSYRWYQGLDEIELETDGLKF